MGKHKGNLDLTALYFLYNLSHIWTCPDFLVLVTEQKIHKRRKVAADDQKLFS